MIYLKFKYKKNIHFGVIKHNDKHRVHILSNNFLISTKKTEQTVKLNKIELLAPVTPSKIIAVGLNYKDHIKELGFKTPKEPCLFLKASTSIIGPGEKIIYPSMVKRLDYEAELAIVIKTKTKNITADKALAHVLGYTCLNDVTARDLQKKDGQWARAKSFDTFCPIGPYIIDKRNVDGNNLTIESFLNGNLKQKSSTNNFLFKIEKIISFISQVMTLFPGDIIATGTPSGIGPMTKSDTIEIKIEKIGSLCNYVA